jgi:hypothetical protein
VPLPFQFVLPIAGNQKLTCGDLYVKTYLESLYITTSSGQFRITAARSRVILENLIVTNVIKKFFRLLWKPEGSLSCSQLPVIGYYYPEPNESNPCRNMTGAPSICKGQTTLSALMGILLGRAAAYFCRVMEESAVSIFTTEELRWQHLRNVNTHVPNYMASRLTSPYSRIFRVCCVSHPSQPLSPVLEVPQRGFKPNACQHPV